MTLSIDLFDAELARRKRSDSTRRRYWDTLEDFGEFLGRNEPTQERCRAYLDQWVDAPPALAQKVTVLSQFFGFLYDEEIISSNPMARIKRPKLTAAEDLDVTSVSSADVERLFAAARDWDERICLAVLVYLGLRRTAAANLRLSDVDFEKGTVRAREKGGKVIVKPMPDELAAILKEANEAGVWDLAGDLGRSDQVSGGTLPSGYPSQSLDPYLIPNRRAPRGSKRSAKVVNALVLRLSERARVAVHPHALRAAFAVRYLEENESDTYGLQKLMGHRRPETTQIYLRRYDDRRAMEKVRSLSWGAA